MKNSILILTIIITGCGLNQEEKNKKLQQDLYDEVMVMHDEVMPKISNILSLEKDLEGGITELDSLDPNYSEQVKILKNQIARLQQADESMMQWMRNFEVNQEGWPHDSIMSYLSKEKERISEVRDQMLGAIKGAEDLVK